MIQLKNKLLVLLFLISFNSLNAQIVKSNIKTFLDNSISKKEYSINNFEKLISTDSYDHSLLLNKAVRFKVYLEAQNFSIKNYEDNCKDISREIGITNIKFNNSLEKSINNAKFLFTIALKKDTSFKSEYEKILKSQSELIKPYFKYSDSNCYSVLQHLQLRNKGIFVDEKLGKNVLSFKYILNPANELLENHIQEFSSLKNSSNEDFFFKIDLPTSWSFKEKKTFSKSTTVGYFKPNENFLNGSISASILANRIISKEKMIANNITDNDIIDFIYEDKEIISNIIKQFDSKILTNKVNYTLYNYGDKKIILYKGFYNLGKVSKNELLNEHNAELLTAIYVKNGKIIIINCGAVQKNNNFNSYNYYSKIFYKVITSIKFKDVKKDVLYLTEEQNMKFIELNIENFKYKFLLDTGASNIVINKKIISELLENGIITKNNYLGKHKVEIANGTIITCENWLIPEITIGHKKIKKLEVSVVDSENSIPLFGMEGLNKLNVLKLNLSENEIILNNE